jgi:sugar lactone lactonase YvrE
MKRVVLTLVALAAVAVSGSHAAGVQSFPEVIPLPDGFQPEGIVISGRTFYVGSIPTGASYRGDLRSGLGSVLVRGGEGRAAIGIDIDRRRLFDHGRLFVAGGPTGKAFVYDARTGRVGTSRRGTRVAVETVPLTGDIRYTTGFNVNGIDATPNGQTLILVQSNTGKLFTATTGGVTHEIDLGGGSVPNGDGILLDGRTLYVVQNRDNKIAVIALAADLRSGRITRYITDPDFDVPTTIDDYGRRLYAVNARFGTPSPATAHYEIVQVQK